MNNPYVKNPKAPYVRLMTPGRERMLRREAAKLEKMQRLYRNTPELPEPVEGQIWVTADYPASRQVSRRTALLEAKLEAGRAKKQPRANPRGNRAMRRAAVAQISKLPQEQLVEIMDQINKLEAAETVQNVDTNTEAV